MCGMPLPSRITVTSPASPGSSALPEVVRQGGRAPSNDDDGGHERDDDHDGEESQKDTAGDDDATHPARLGHRRTTTRGRAVATDLDVAVRRGCRGHRVLPRRPHAGPPPRQRRARRRGRRGAAVVALRAAVAAHLPGHRAGARRGGLRHRLREPAADPGARLRRPRPHPRRGRHHDPVVGHPPVGGAGRGAGDRRRRACRCSSSAWRRTCCSGGTGRSPSSSPRCWPRPTPRRCSPCCAGCRSPGRSPGMLEAESGFNDAPVVLLVTAIAAGTGPRARRPTRGGRSWRHGRRSSWSAVR